MEGFLPQAPSPARTARWEYAGTSTRFRDDPRGDHPAFHALFSPACWQKSLWQLLPASSFLLLWNMSELPHFIEILKGQKGDALTLLITFILTVLMDLTLAVQVGVLVSAMVFLKRMNRFCDHFYQIRAKYPSSMNTRLSVMIPSKIAVFELNGPFFHSVSHLLDEALIQLRTPPKAFVLCLH